jgi:probable rRNA maturation factor
MIDLVWENCQSRAAWNGEFVLLAQKCIEKTLQTEGFEFDAEVGLLFVDNGQIREINRDQRRTDRVTDVLSFPLLEQEAGGSLIVYDEDFVEDKVLLGDIVISLERAYRQAEEFGHSINRELGFLVVHSALHLLGYDHEKGEREEREMFLKQENILRELDLIR